MMAKSLLPRFGGSAGVWIACMLFFQVALLLGYLYSYLLTRCLGVRAQALVHLAVAAASLCVLPLKARVEAASAPTGTIVWSLALSVGLPYFVVSATSPLMQSWLAGQRGKHLPYRLYALSNAASLLALLAYPVVVEPFLPLRVQMNWWSAGFGVLVLLVGFAAGANLRRDGAAERPRPIAGEHHPVMWIALAACASTLWLAIANYLGQQVAAMPFLWVLPMSVYLLSFILCFEADGWYRPEVFRWLMPVAWAAFCSRLALESPAGGLRWEIPVFCAALFICCMFCHGELARSKPGPRNGLSFFYLMVACGGALGGIFVALVAPNVFSTFLELPIGVTASVFLGLYFLFGLRAPRRLARLALFAALAFVASTQYHDGRRVVRTRNFYGVLEIRDAGEGGDAGRALYSGRTIHGLELMAPALRRTPTTYYGIESGAGRVLASSRFPHSRVAIVGLGAGTLAVYGEPGDSYRFYEIDPAVIRAARGSFDFLSTSAATVDVVRGDGRLMLDREPAHTFDIVALDAFSDDAVPVHLLTLQAFEMYFQKLRPGGLLLIHLTNRYLDLAAEVEAVTVAMGKAVVCIHSVADPAQRTQSADWAVVAATAEALAPLRAHALPPSQRKVRPWTDEASSVFPLWK